MNALREAAQHALESMMEFRDAVLNNRGSLEEGILDNDKTNAVLDQFDGDCGNAIGDLRNALAQPDDKVQPVEGWHGDRKVSVYADPFSYIIQRLNSNPYALTKNECITLIQNLRNEYTPVPQPAAEQGAELSDEQMAALQKAWYGVGADLAGLKWGDFVAVLAADRGARGGAV